MGVEGGAYGEDDGHGADHERGVADGGEGEAEELDEELERDSEEGGDEEDAPFAGVKAGLVGEKEGEEREAGEGETVEDHGAYVHLGEGDFAEEEAAAPEGAGDEAGGEAEGAVLGHGFRVAWKDTTDGADRERIKADRTDNGKGMNLQLTAKGSLELTA